MLKNVWKMIRPLIWILILENCRTNHRLLPHSVGSVQRWRILSSINSINHRWWFFSWTFESTELWWWRWRRCLWILRKELFCIEEQSEWSNSKTVVWDIELSMERESIEAKKWTDGERRSNHGSNVKEITWRTSSYWCSSSFHHWSLGTMPWYFFLLLD